jgi:diguanylate cyclase (GGDEF)-like protein
VNDSLGHHAGDILLCEASNRILAQVRETDTVCRLGGDEFTVILENINASEDAATVAQKIIECLTESFTIEDSEVFVGTSIGIALFPFDGDTPEELSKRADAAMYDAKEHGRGQLRFASGESGKSSKKRLETETGLRKGLELGEFFIEYQPQVSAGAATSDSSQGIIGAEALVRWKPQGGGIVYPDEFIQIAEESGLIIPLGARILLESCIEAKRWLDYGRPLVVSVNASQLQFERGRIIEQVSDALKASNLPPQLLKIEITESIFSRNMKRMAEIMHELKDMGVSLALDDFGTGYSSLRYIDKLPFDTLKIDKAFIQSIDSPYEGGEIATAIVSLARSFGMESIAEGVETPEQLDALRSRGCDTIQGFFVSKPLSVDGFRSFLSQTSETRELEPQV